MNPADEPSPLPEEASRLLAHYVAARQMPAGDAERVARAIGVAAPPAARTARTRGLWIGVAAAAGVVLTLLFAELWPRRAAIEVGDAPRDLAEDRAVPSAPDRAAAAPMPVPAELPEIRGPRDAPAPDRDTTPSAAVRRRAGAPVPPPAVDAAPAAPASTMAAERELLTAAWQAIEAGRTDRAAAIVERHRARFARGVLVPERDALAAIVRCAESGPESATVDAFDRAHPGSVLLPQVRAACRTR